MRSISQLVVALMMIGIAIVASVFTSIVIAEIMQAYSPGGGTLARVGSPSLEFIRMDKPSQYTRYLYQVVLRLINMGSAPIEIQGGTIYIMIAYNQNAQIIGCDLVIDNNKITINPSETKTLIGSCVLVGYTLRQLYGFIPSPEWIKRDSAYLYLKLSATMRDMPVRNAPTTIAEKCYTIVM